jgi:predicted lipoprotein with Yx(FWY)xxD motif
VKKRGLFALAPVAAAVAIAGCGGGSKTESTPAQAKTAGTVVSLHHSHLGMFLSDAKGRTLYLFEADKGIMSTCYSACASVWPPLTSTGAVTAGAGVNASLLGSTKRKDGTIEVTYKRHPLYYYAADSTPGQTTGQGLNQFGAKWYVLAANGNKIDDDAR